MMARSWRRGLGSVHAEHQVLAMLTVEETLHIWLLP